MGHFLDWQGCRRPQSTVRSVTLGRGEKLSKAPRSKAVGKQCSSMVSGSFLPPGS